MATSRSLGGRLRALHGRSRFSRWFRLHLALSLVWFLVGSAFGALLVGVVPVDQLASYAPDGAGGGMFPDRLTVWAIFSNNVVAMGIMLLGAVTFGVLSAFALAFNGFVVGAVVPLALRELSPLVVAAFILPHGVVELPALFAAGAVGFRVPHRVVRFLLGWDERPITRVELYELAVLTVVLVLLIAVAAVIEVEITPRIAERVRAAGL